MSAGPKPRRLMWVDVEATGLPNHYDFSDVHLLEIAVIITDFNLNMLDGYHETVKMNEQIAAAVRANPYVKDMHTKSGLLKDSIKKATLDKDQIEQEIIDMIQEFGEPGEFVIAGSGVAMYDFPWIKTHMPNLETWLAYFPIDIGVERRTSKILTGINIVSHTPASYGTDKLHRALADIEGHLDEARKYREVLRAAFVTEEHSTAQEIDLEGPL